MPKAIRERISLRRSSSRCSVRGCRSSSGFVVKRRQPGRGISGGASLPGTVVPVAGEGGAVVGRRGAPGSPGGWGGGRGGGGRGGRGGGGGGVRRPPATAGFPGTS